MNAVILLLVIIILGLCIIYMRQNNTCVLKQKSIEKYSANNLGELNDWARDVQPATPLNNWCVGKDNTGGDLAEGQFCQANCAGIGNNRTGWYPGGKIKKVGNGLQWEKGPGYWVDFNQRLPGDSATSSDRTSLSKIGYCQHVGQ
jgi:hypothetical protein